MGILDDEPDGEQIKYDEAVIRGKRLVEIIHPSEIELGMIADKLEPKYGKQTLRRYAEELPIDYNTLKGYRATYRAWKDKPSRPKNYSVAKALNKHPDKYELHQLYGDDLTVKIAREEMWREQEESETQAKLFEDSDLELGKQTKKVIKYLDRVLKEGSDQREMIQDIKVKDTTTTGLYINRIDEALGRLIKRARDMILAVRSKPLVVG